MASESRNERPDRKGALAILARATAGELDAAWAALDDAPDLEVVRAPEFGLVMARGRIGGGGGAFNIGEVAVTRAVVRASTGEVGYGNVLGRDRARALLVARFDALWQSARHRRRVEESLLQPVARRAEAEDAALRGKAAATRVNFFTMVRGED
ncbi:phosphonate C-P lyase system protein PhnG [Propylenella binzhouense]|uniref:Phosphonate C-P lyase system protein PhnG n=1 Tax=Propylenella binzhouense TaxID=2555902 RepID=A0A964T6Y5_9HYPH|nr:phosphonate C-P lyase system protein PhnG [Propylenella binzhouense]MYZ48974.1 phosphonate C-P lyase system protein PhnG [Propylenella binzhouense]